MKKNNIWSQSQVPLANYTLYSFCILVAVIFLSEISPTFNNSGLVRNVAILTIFSTPILGSLVVWRSAKGDTFTDKLMSVANTASKTVFFSTILCGPPLAWARDSSFGENPAAWSIWIISLCVAFYLNLNPSPKEKRTVVDAIALTFGQIVISIILIFVILKVIRAFFNSLRN